MLAAKLTAALPIYHCPKCDRTTTAEWIHITLGGRDDRYCLYCYAMWVEANLPKLELEGAGA